MTTSTTTARNARANEPIADTLARLIPALDSIKHYKRRWLISDIMAGIVLCTVLIPIGMGYAEAAGLPMINGIYSTLFPLVAYAIFGPSRVLVVGPDSSLVALIAAVVVPLSNHNPERAVGYASVLAILCGFWCIIAGWKRLGFVTDLLSKPIRYGYLNGIAVAVIMGQLPIVCGLGRDGDNVVSQSHTVINAIASKQVNTVALALGVGCIIFILSCRRWIPRIPGSLIAVLAALAIVAGFQLASTAHVPVVGVLPAGIPWIHSPALCFDDLGPLLSGSLAITVVSFADMSLVSRTFANRRGYKVNPDQELVALGLANVFSGLFQGYSVSASATRTPVAESAGGKTQMTGLVAALCIAILLVFPPGVFRLLPKSALAAVVICACISLVEIRGVLRLWKVRPVEFLSCIVCFFGVICLGAIQGIFLSIGMALLAFVWRAWRPHHAVLGRVDGLKGYHDIVRHPDANRPAGLVLFRWDAPLFFANAGIFHEQVSKAIAESPSKVRRVIIAAEPVTDVDITAADELSQLEHELLRANIELCFAEMKGPVKDELKRYGTFTELGSANFFDTLGQAVDNYITTYHVPWVDWHDKQKRDGTNNSLKNQS